MMIVSIEYFFLFSIAWTVINQIVFEGYGFSQNFIYAEIIIWGAYIQELSAAHIPVSLEHINLFPVLSMWRHVYILMDLLFKSNGTE